MQAIVVHKLSENFDNLGIEARPVPEPGPGQVRVRMRYAPINPSDRNAIHGTYHEALRGLIWNHNREHPTYDPEGHQPIPQPPYVPGGEGMGVVEASGGGWLANRLRGKRVAFAAGPPQGSWQASTVVDATRCVALPAAVDDQQGAMFFVNPLTAYVLVRHVLAVPKGAWLLQTAAGSALGKHVVCLGRRLGFRTLNVVRSRTNVETLRALGADAVVVTEEEDLAARVAKLTNGRGVHYATDCVGGALTADVVRCLGRGGRLLLYGTLGADTTPLVQRHLMMPGARVDGFFLPTWLSRQSAWTLLRKSIPPSAKHLRPGARARSCSPIPTHEPQPTNGCRVRGNPLYYLCNQAIMRHEPRKLWRSRINHKPTHLLHDPGLWARVDALLADMDRAAKIRELSGPPVTAKRLWRLLRAYNYGPIRAGGDQAHEIPPLAFSDGPRGIVMNHATCFPAAMARGASWDPVLEARIGAAMGMEAAALGANIVAAPCINLLRHPGWGRAQETYGEDPLHVGAMGAAAVRGLQQSVCACPKHFAANSIENSRFRVDVRIAPRPLHELYLRQSPQRTLLRAQPHAFDRNSANTLGLSRVGHVGFFSGRARGGPWSRSRLRRRDAACMALRRQHRGGARQWVVGARHIQRGRAARFGGQARL